MRPFLCVFVILLSSSACNRLDRQMQATASARKGPAEADIDRSQVLKYRGALKGRDGKRLTGVFGVLFAIYEQKEGGAPVWQEVQNVDVDKHGHFVALVGATTGGGIPSELFATEKTPWLGMQVLLPGEVEQPRIRLERTAGGLRATRLVLPNATTEETAKTNATARDLGETPPNPQDQSEPPRRSRRARHQFQRPPMP